MARKLSRHPRGSLVTFINPTTKRRGSGTIVDEVWFPEPESFAENAARSESGWVETAFVAQLVEWGPDNRRIRIAYYTRRDGPNRWVFGQYAASIGTKECLALFRGMEERGWFKGLPE